MDTKKVICRVLLIDDQMMIGEAVRRMLAPEGDIVYEFCAKPGEALARAEQFKPTVILQDLVMPEIDGLTLVNQFRATTSLAEIPLIVLSSKEEAKTKAEAFANGANDYLVKLPDRIELLARIRYHSRSFLALQERNEAYAALHQSREELAAELAEAASYVRTLLPEPREGKEAITWRFIPSSSLGGDAFGYHALDDENFALFLLDVCGHGVGAALLSVSAMNVLSTRSLAGVNFLKPSEVAAGLNAAFPMEKQNNMYFTIWYGVLNRPTRTLRYCSAGHPPAVSISAAGETQMLKAKGMVIGAMPDIEYGEEETVIAADSKLYLFSDGAYEIARPAGGMMSLDDLVKMLQEPVSAGQERLDQVLQKLRVEQGGDLFADDCSIVEFLLP